MLVGKGCYRKLDVEETIAPAEPSILKKELQRVTKVPVAEASIRCVLVSTYADNGTVRGLCLWFIGCAYGQNADLFAAAAVGVLLFRTY